MYERTLAEESTGFSGVVARLSGEPHLVERLAEIGIIPGDTIRLRGRATFGEPIIVEVKGTSFALRRREARCVLVR